MKMSRCSAFLAAVLLSLPLCALRQAQGDEPLRGAERVGAQGRTGAEMPWDDQLREMIYDIYHISGLNAMNALNLSREQIRQLMALARTVEAAGAKPPLMKGNPTEGLAGVREAYHDLTVVLMQGKELSPALKARVAQARVKEAQAIRASLGGKSDHSAPAVKCTGCHAAPAKGTALEPPGPAEGTSFLGKRITLAGETKNEAMAHFGGVAGARGVQVISQLAPQVVAILNDGQKQIMEDFACCLIPPDELSNPVRAGQAEVSDKTVKMLHDIRSKPDAAWDAQRPYYLTLYKKMYLAYNPGSKEQELNDCEQRWTETFDKARKMSDAQFELNKESLCAELKMDKKYADGRKTHPFKYSFFLLMPGSTPIYNALLKRPECK